MSIFKFTLNWRTQQINPFPQIITLDKQPSSIYVISLLLSISSLEQDH